MNSAWQRLQASAIIVVKQATGRTSVRTRFQARTMAIKMKMVVVTEKVVDSKGNAESVESKGIRLLNAGTMIKMQVRGQIGLRRRPEWLHQVAVKVQTVNFIDGAAD